MGVKWKVTGGWRESQAITLGQHGFLDGVEEPDELLVAMALHAPANYLALKDVEGSKGRGGAVTLVVMGHGAGAA